ncbi:MAG: nitronate monooxygenase [Steroidobacteraceae bacterium]
MMEDHRTSATPSSASSSPRCARCSCSCAKNARLNRLPDFVVVEGPLAGGRLGFGMDWAAYDLRTIVAEIGTWLRAEQLDIALIPAGGIFTGSDAVSYLANGAAAVQVATRFTVTRECGLPDEVNGILQGGEADIEVNMISPTGYPMRMLKNSPAIGAGVRPNCGPMATCSTPRAIAPTSPPTTARSPRTRTRARSRSWTRPACAPRCATSIAGPAGTIPTGSRTPPPVDGSYRLLSAEHVFRDFLYSVDGRIAFPPREPVAARALRLAQLAVLAAAAVVATGPAATGRRFPGRRRTGARRAARARRASGIGASPPLATLEARALGQPALGAVDRVLHRRVDLFLHTAPSRGRGQQSPPSDPGDSIAARRPVNRRLAPIARAAASGYSPRAVQRGGGAACGSITY